ncbi:hypothetical protein ACFOTA_08580 [Chitinophaga sp. GCM10012297]|uniref:Uncharacterized protein n=1 Tax=Chitinophaga chungangae TaxID=2821488 RepID=A0ABS3YDR2_9BACT|nr:hypothetical protein [Chitinophaga chungangae]MBO9152259.1 hypothetical protein [Chitinophaga chungangae]
MRTFNQFVTVQLSPEMLVKNTGSLPAYLSRVQEEKLRITGQLLELSSSPEDPAHAAMIRQWQNMCVELLDTIHRFRFGHRATLPASAAPDETDIFYGSVEEMLQAVLVAMEQHFSKLLLPGLHLPLSYAARARQQLQPRLKAAERELKKSGLDPDLLELVLAPVKRFTGDADVRISFQELAYYRDLLGQLVTAASFESVPADQFNLEAHFLLVHLNFNSAEYFLYCTSRMRRWLRQFSDMQGRVNTLTWCIREIRNIPPFRDGKGFQANGFHIKDQLAAWLEEERIFIRTLMTTIAQPPAAANPEEEKMTAFLAIPQAALMARVYMEEGIIRSTSVQQLFAAVANMLQLKKTDAGMEDVFRLKFFNPSLATVTTCKNWLSRVLDRLNDYEDQMRAHTGY